MPSFEIESLYPGEVIFGIDEAGLGPLAGPAVFASCRIINHTLLQEELLLGIDDSKKLSKKKREFLFELITNCDEIDYGIAIVENTEIDEIGLSAAWQNGITESIKSKNPTLCLIDGIRNVNLKLCRSIPIVKGDQKSYSIAAASILAKVTRDRIMLKIHNEFPDYGFDKHVGYGTKLHIDNLKKFGPCKYHRKSYSPVRKAMEENCNRETYESKDLSS